VLLLSFFCACRCSAGLTVCSADNAGMCKVQQPPFCDYTRKLIDDGHAVIEVRCMLLLLLDCCEWCGRGL